MDQDLLEWVSYEELQELETDNLIKELQSKLLVTEKFNIDQITLNQSKSQELIREIDLADSHLSQLQTFLQSTLDNLQEIRSRTGPLEAETSAYRVEQRNLSSLRSVLASIAKK
jgi:hypothetical protein